MRAAGARYVAASFFAALLAGACGVEVSGLGTGATVDDAGAGDATAGGDGSIPGDGATPGSDASGDPGEAGRDAADDAEAGPIRDGGDACAARPEDCTNGIDDNCNGAVDCADPACQPGFECVPAVPTSWAYGEVNLTQRPSCNAGFGGQTDVVVDPQGAAATCGCTCSQSGTASCTNGNALFSSTGSKVVAVCSTIGSQPAAFPGSAGCHNLPQIVNAEASVYVKIDPVPPSGLTCGGNGAPTGSIPQASSKSGRLCGAPARLGGGCNGTDVCAPKVSNGFSSCVVRSGAQSCPGAYPQAHVIGGAVTDNRGCSSCTCGSTVTCTSPTLSFYEQAGCTNGSTGDTSAVDEPADATCRQNNLTMNKPLGSYTYSATVANVGCQPTSTSTPTGGVDVSSKQTACCR